MSVAEKVANLPDSPGVYLMKNAEGKIIYVGKAVNLKNRVRSYFRTLKPDALKTKALVKNIADLEYIVVASEIEALVLECNLIKKYRPKYNISLKDDKTYPYLKITNEMYPRIIVTRVLKKDGGKYYGPYPSVNVLRETLELLRGIFPFRTCNQHSFTNKRPCLNYHIKRCYAPCVGLISKEEYNELVQKVADFFDGNHADLLKRLNADMQKYSDELNFEQALRVRDQILGIERAISEQRAVLENDEDADILAMYRENEEIAVQAFFVRSGKIVGRESYFLKENEDGNESVIMQAFVKQFYFDNKFIAPNIVLDVDLEEKSLLEEWLAQKRGSKVVIKNAKRGKHKDLLDLAKNNAKEVLEKKIGSENLKNQKLSNALLDLKNKLGLKNLPTRIECYDISNTQGTESVASMVVFVDGKPRKDQYRRFKIKTVEGPNDFASMYEVLSRRLGRLDSKDKFAENNPNLIIVDGGKGQLAYAVKILSEMKCSQIELVGLAKREEILFRPGDEEGVYLPRESESLYLVQRIRDEAHRFAITYHRTLRGKRNLASVLDDINGVGKKRKTALLMHFGSLTKIMQASVEEIAQVEGIGEVLAEEISEYLKTHNELNERLKIYKGVK